jgi:hypothetical protein
VTHPSNGNRRQGAPASEVAAAAKKTADRVEQSALESPPRLVGVASAKQMGSLYTGGGPWRDFTTRYALSCGRTDWEHPETEHLQRRARAGHNSELLPAHFSIIRGNGDCFLDTMNYLTRGADFTSDKREDMGNKLRDELCNWLDTHGFDFKLCFAAGKVSEGAKKDGEVDGVQKKNNEVAAGMKKAEMEGVSLSTVLNYPTRDKWNDMVARMRLPLCYCEESMVWAFAVLKKFDVFVLSSGGKVITETGAVSGMDSWDVRACASGDTRPDGQKAARTLTIANWVGFHFVPLVTRQGAPPVCPSHAR